MHILALDTTTRAGSVAVARDGSLLHELSGDPSLTHGERLPGDVVRALDAVAIRVEDLGLLAVAAGPGSFTGLRVGIAAVQGLAVARALNVVPVPTLEVLARTSEVRQSVAPDIGRKPERELVAAWMDGQRGEVFAALYEILPPEPRSAEAGGRTNEIQPPMAGNPAAVLDMWSLPPDVSIVFIGDGAIRYREAIVERLGARVRVVEPPPLAATIARIAFEEPHRAVGPHAIVPVYVRRPDAELARERRHTTDVQARGQRPEEGGV